VNGNRKPADLVKFLLNHCSMNLLLRYFDWVEGKIKKVSEATNGAWWVDIHIPEWVFPA
jgi:hypothetical protein